MVLKKQVKVSVGKDDFHALKKGKYKLCISKQMKRGGYTVIWDSYLDFLPHNKFTWTPDYWVYGANQFQLGLQVFPSTNVQAICVGEICTMDPEGWLGNAMTGGSESAYTFSTTYKSGIYPGMIQLFTGWDGLQKSAPVFLDPNFLLFGDRAFRPREVISLWWEQRSESGQLIASIPANSIELDLLNASIVQVDYTDGQWKKRE